MKAIPCSNINSVKPCFNHCTRFVVSLHCKQLFNDAAVVVVVVVAPPPRIF